MDYLLNNPFPKWIVSYIIHRQIGLFTWYTSCLDNNWVPIFLPKRECSNQRWRQGELITIEIINNTRGGIEGKIGERVAWGENLSPGCSLIRDVPDKKVVFRQIFLLFKLFFAVKYWKYHSRLSKVIKPIEKSTILPTKPKTTSNNGEKNISYWFLLLLWWLLRKH